MNPVEHVLFAPIKLYSTRFRIPTNVLPFILTLGIIVGLQILSIPDEIRRLLMIVLIIPVVFGLPLVINRCRTRFPNVDRLRARYSIADGKADPDAYEAAHTFQRFLTKMEHRRQVEPGFDRATSRSEGLEDDSAADSIQVRAIVDHLLRKEIQRVELTESLIEEESIGPTIGREGLIAAVILTVAVVSAAVSKGDVFLLLYWLVFCTIFVFPYFSFFREHIPLLRLYSTEILAGPGWLRDHANVRRWTIENSMLLLHLPGRRVLGPIWLHIIGPAGIQTLVFGRARDPEFVRLWQRWMHPNPRLELIAEDA